MKTSTVPRSLVTAAPYLHPKQLLKRDVYTCGDLRGAYTNVQAPICSGATSICTFDGSLQGCCDDQNQCQFYTTCIGLYSPQSCVGSFCLPCSSPAPYCVKYNFYDAQSQRAYDGYSCAEFQPSKTIWGLASSVLGVEMTTSSSSAAATSMTASTDSSETPVLTRFNTTQSLFSTSTTSSNSSSLTMSSGESSSSVTATAIPQSKHVSHTGAIAGGVVGALLFVALIAVVLLCLRKGRSGRNARVPRVGSRVGEVQQRDY